MTTILFLHSEGSDGVTHPPVLATVNNAVCSMIHKTVQLDHEGESRGRL